MKLAAISMIRDEADIVASFLRHLDSMFDIVFLLDQRSSDGSTTVMKAACGQRADWSYYLCDFAGRYQKELINLLTPKAFEMGAEALFILDSDEFIALESSDELRRRALDMQNMAAAGRFFWRACLPVRFDEWKFDQNAPAWIARKAAAVPKVAMSRALFEQQPDLRFQQGSHGFEGTEHEPPMIELGDLYHFPLRSRPQAVLKTCIGAIANFSKGNLMKEEGWHKRQMLEHIAAGGLDDASLAGFASLYGEVSARNPYGEAPRMIAETFEKQVLPIACSDLALPELEETDFDAALAHVLLEFQFEPASDSAPAFEVRGDVISLRKAQLIPMEQIINTYSSKFHNINTAIDSINESIKTIGSQITNAQSEITNMQTAVWQLGVDAKAVRNINWLIKISKSARRLLGRRIYGE